MSDESQVKISIVTTADPSGVQQARNDYDELFADLKKGIADTLQAGGADKKFIGHVVDEFERLNVSLKESGASGDEVAQKIAQLQERLMQDAAAEEKRIQQRKVDFEYALQIKEAEEEAARTKRIRREEDQLAMELEGIRLKEQTQLLEQQIMARLRQERLAREAVESTQAMGKAFDGAKRSIGDTALVAAQFVDDAQYGLRGIMNNIPQLALAFGMGSGLAGSISIAAVALNLLWEKFGQAKEAKAETEKVTSSVKDLEDALKRSSEAADKAFQKDLSQYVAEVEKAATSWRNIKSEISAIVDRQKELRDIQNQIANSQLELERQAALANAKDADQKKAINSQYDARKAALNSGNELDKANFDLESKRAQLDLLKQQFGNVSDQVGGTEGAVGTAKRDLQDFGREYGSQSDQGRNVAAAEAAQRQIFELQARQRKINELIESNKFGDEEDLRALLGELERIPAKIDAAVKERDSKLPSLKSDREAMESGQGLKFDKWQSEAKTAADAGDTGPANALSSALDRQKENEARLKAQEELLVKTKTEQTEASQRITEIEKDIQLALLKVEAAALKQAESFAKAGGAAAEAEREAAEKAAKKAREEQLRKLENDAAEAEKNHDYTGAAKNRNEAARLKLGPDATPEQRRELDRLNRDRLMEGERRQTGYQQQQQAKDIGERTGNLANNLGETGKDLKKAAEQLKDGATPAELDGVLKAMMELIPAIREKFQGSDKKVADVIKEVQLLKQQLLNGRLGNA
ncbi:coiled-coil domain-containing protein [Prosthecobacter vanneervenii]|uniref:Uncharacterized protein n=1 Tax=Prosthecobacter vanneervenii TaxID=48466 RepID=A0A7W7YBP9_9BACT|nr:hypothetical protein [Prosthecobacter vanneervenii]MBB5033174.1 hypothetical protein [Prosthecobacter vanneervenii]